MFNRGQEYGTKKKCLFIGMKSPREQACLCAAAVGAETRKSWLVSDVMPEKSSVYGLPAVGAERASYPSKRKRLLPMNLFINEALVLFTRARYRCDTSNFSYLRTQRFYADLRKKLMDFVSFLAMLRFALLSQ